MDKNMHKREVAKDISMEQARQTYSLLNEEVRRWQDERGTFWMEELSPTEAPPYYALVDLPEEAILEVWQRLNQVTGVVVSETDLRERWNEFKAVQSIKDTEMLSRLYIALSAVARLSRETLPDLNMVKANSHAEDQPIEVSYQGRACQICGETTALSVLAPPNGKRYLHCIVCDHEWPVERVGCICCGSKEHTQQTYLNSAEFPGVDVVACIACGEYFKEVDLRVLSVKDFVWEELRTLPLNFAAEQWFADQAKVTGKVQ